MKLYIWRPNGHGSHTFSTIAGSEVEAFAVVDAFVKGKYGKLHPAVVGKVERIGMADVIIPAQLAREDYKYEAEGWGTDYYKLEVYEMGQVAEHEND